MNTTTQKPITRKLNSSRGASLAMALLLFLVCSVLGAVVLTAGTAATGRIADMAEMDRRYYNVTSAAELLAKEFGGTTVTIERTETVTRTVTTPYTVSGPLGNETVTAGTPVTATDVSYGTSIDGVPVLGTSFAADSAARSFLTSRAVVLLFGKDGTGDVTCNTASAWSASLRSPKTESGSGYTLTHTTGDVTPVPQEISLSYEITGDGTLRIVLESDGYAVCMTMHPALEETEVTQLSGGGDPAVVHTDESHYTETVTTTETVTIVSRVTWTCESIR